jgi:hypothetical protein
MKTFFTALNTRGGHIVVLLALVLIAIWCLAHHMDTAGMTILTGTLAALWTHVTKNGGGGPTRPDGTLSRGQG